MLRAATMETDFHSNRCATMAAVETFFVSLVTHGCLHYYTTMGTLNMISRATGFTGDV
jgi:hypothetical protein